MMGVPLVGLVHIAMGSFLSLQAYYGSTFVDGTGAVVGVGLLRNLGGLMTGLTFAGILRPGWCRSLRILSRLPDRVDDALRSAVDPEWIGACRRQIDEVDDSSTAI